VEEINGHPHPDQCRPHPDQLRDTVQAELDYLLDEQRKTAELCITLNAALLTARDKVQSLAAAVELGCKFLQQLEAEATREEAVKRALETEPQE
jgi:hypothetical protein